MHTAGKLEPRVTIEYCANGYTTGNSVKITIHDNQP